MISLLIDTSSEYFLIALAQGETLIKEVIKEHHNHLSQTLFPSLQQLLAETSYSLRDLTYLAVGTGPGSYTGTRIAAISAKTLAFALNIPLVGFCSLLAFLPPCKGSFSLLQKGKKRFLFEGICEEDTITYTLKEITAPPEGEELSPLPQPSSLLPLRYAYQQFIQGKTSFPHSLTLIYI